MKVGKDTPELGCWWLGIDGEFGNGLFNHYNSDIDPGEYLFTLKKIYDSGSVRHRSGQDVMRLFQPGVLPNEL